MFSEAGAVSAEEAWEDARAEEYLDEDFLDEDFLLEVFLDEDFLDEDLAEDFLFEDFLFEDFEDDLEEEDFFLEEVLAVAVLEDEAFFFAPYASGAGATQTNARTRNAETKRRSHRLEGMTFIRRSRF